MRALFSASCMSCEHLITSRLTSITIALLLKFKTCAYPDRLHCLAFTLGQRMCMIFKEQLELLETSFNLWSSQYSCFFLSIRMSARYMSWGVWRMTRRYASLDRLFEGGVQLFVFPPVPTRSFDLGSCGIYVTVRRGGWGRGVYLTAIIFPPLCASLSEDVNPRTVTLVKEASGAFQFVPAPEISAIQSSLEWICLKTDRNFWSLQNLALLYNPKLPARQHCTIQLQWSTSILSTFFVPFLVYLSWTGLSVAHGEDPFRLVRRDILWLETSWICLPSRNGRRSESGANNTVSAIDLDWNCSDLHFPTRRGDLFNHHLRPTYSHPQLGQSRQWNAR